ncbi:MAG: hypothetical protein DMF44_15390 [Verrucomicrobia bacterium]|nr:MAG: hypothetical protein DMF44_15390 [Verrucomicrobiota bacterium]
MQAISRLDRIIPHNPPLRELLAFRKNDPAEPPVIFHINKKNEIETWQPDWNPSELEVERHLMSSTGEDSSILNEEIFKEPLLLLSSQVRTRLKKRADLLAIDRDGNGVVIELKRHHGSMGVDTQALQYLSDFSSHRGMGFLSRFKKGDEKSVEEVRGFLGDAVAIDDINKATRVILVARSFDETLYSMGEWLCSMGVAYRCIAYTPFNVGSKNFLSFSVAFDRSPRLIHRLGFRETAREPGAKWHGAVGWGTIENPKSYRLIEKGSADDKLGGFQRHRLNISWKAVAPKLEDGMSAAKVSEDYRIYHPISTSVPISPGKARELRDALNQRFK